MRFLFHLSGEHPEMAAAEVQAVFEAIARPLTVLASTPGFLDGHAEVFADELDVFLPRLGLTHTACIHLFIGAPGAWPADDVGCCLPEGVSLSVRAERLEPGAAWRRPEVERDVGALLAPGRRIRLDEPEVHVWAFLLRDRICVGRQVWASDPQAWQARHVDRRPFSSPVSLDPRLARALVNLSRVPSGGTVLDPFCGTGGILLEASAMGLRAVGSDLDPSMVAGTRTNLTHYGLAAEVFESDVGRVAVHLSQTGRSTVDAVVSDLPYGRSSGTAKEPIQSLYARAFDAVADVLRPGGYAVLGLPNQESVETASRRLALVDTFRVRAHKSLTRHFTVLRRT